MPGCTGKNDTETHKIEVAIARIISIDAEKTIIYTDGSASGGTLNGEASAIITTGNTTGNPCSPTVSETVMKKGAIYTAIYTTKAYWQWKRLWNGWLPTKQHLPSLSPTANLCVGSYRRFQTWIHFVSNYESPNFLSQSKGFLATAASPSTNCPTQLPKPPPS